MTLRLNEIIVSKREFEEGVPEEFLSHKEKYEESIRKSVIIFSLMRNMQREGRLTLTHYRDVLECLLGSSTLQDGSPMILHYMMFMPAIMTQATDEQQAYWLTRAWNGEIIGSYAQTELGHGTFIRGLETTATYDPRTQEFVLHTPTLTACKWWAGGMGHTANFSIVVAQLYIQGKCHGVHSFMVQIRDENSHHIMPGIKVGDVGAKMGLQPVNNGFLAFNQVRIPRINMLMKHAQVLEDGTYVKSDNEKLLYAAMVFVRVLIISTMVYNLSRLSTIATRYSAVRRQTPVKEGGPELQILDYMTQQHKLFISIATCYAIKLVARKQWQIFDEVTQEVVDGNMTRLSELHASACCLKALTTSDAARCAESVRLACGGHGYNMSSNLPQHYAQITAACTYEGDNTVLMLQTARFLLKTWQRLGSRPLTPSVKYMEYALQEGFLGKWDNSVDGIIRGLQVVSVRKTARCVEVMEKRIESGMSMEDAWNMTSVQLVAAAEVHSRVIMMTFFREGIQEIKLTASPALRVVLQQLLELYVFYWALEKLVDLLKFTNISKQDADVLQAKYESLLVELRPNAVGLVDAFGLRDEMLKSTLGAYDGRVYERLMEEAQKCPLNKESVNWTYQKYLKPYMQGKL